MNGNLPSALYKKLSISGVIVSLFAVYILLTPGISRGQDQGKEKAAIAAAEAWLALVDAGKYDESWAQAAGYFKNALTEEKWAQALNGVRKPLGNPVSREVKTSQYATSLPGAPDGQYVIIQFQTSFANKASAVETVTPALDNDGKWRVSGYFIK